MVIGVCLLTIDRVLDSSLGKTAGTILKYHIVEYLETEKLMNNTQHGFREGRSCVSALLDSFDLILTNNISSPEWETDAVYLDFSRAFDKVAHGKKFKYFKLQLQWY